jgi:hypothetical protein
MMTKLLMYKWTCLFAVAFLISFLWSAIFSDKLSEIFVLLFSVVFLASIVGSIVLALTRRSKAALYRVLLNVIFCLLLFPTITLGGFLRDRLFLTRLSKFQELTNVLVRDKVNGDTFSAVIPLPPGYSSLNVSDRVLVIARKEKITVCYLLRNSNALSHGGYMYRSDDDPTTLSKDFPKMGYTRVAPHWFFFSE